MITTHIENGVGHMVIDMPGRSMNVFDAPLADAIEVALDELQGDASVSGIVISSGKPGFIAGADLGMMAKFVEPGVSPGMAFEMIARFGRLLRRIETCGKPIVAAAGGTALGGGFELMLSCHYRIATDDPKARFGLPEVGLGLMPAAGGTQRLPRLIGVAASLPLLVNGKPLDAAAARKLGLLHEVVSGNDVVDAAVRALRDGRVKATAPWDEKGFRAHGGDAHAPANAQALTSANATAHASTGGNYPAPRAILRAVYEGSRLPIDKALKLEQQLFVTLVQGQVAQSMIRTLFFARQAADKLAKRPAGIASRPVRRLGILGAGFMGCGVAQVSAAAGIEVVVLDRSVELGEKAVAGIARNLDLDVARNRIPADVRSAILSRIQVARDHSGFADCDMVIEAVLEDMEVKRQSLIACERHMPADAIFASNTSALPIADLAMASKNPQRVVGLHFFSPVSRMALVEVISGHSTSDSTLARSLDFVKQIRKTPIVVRDGYGFYTTRCVEAYIREGIRMVAEGATPALVENAGVAVGMPVGPLTLADEVGIDVLCHISQFFREREHGSWADDKHGAVNRVLEELTQDGRFGRKVMKGFYLYSTEGGRTLDIDVQRSSLQPTLDEVKERLLYAQVVEAARCHDEGIVNDPDEADLGAHLGWAFPAYLGGPLAFIRNQGADEFVRRCSLLVQRYGARFSAPASLQRLSAPA